MIYSYKDLGSDIHGNTVSHCRPEATLNRGPRHSHGRCAMEAAIVTVHLPPPNAGPSTQTKQHVITTVSSFTFQDPSNEHSYSKVQEESRAAVNQPGLARPEGSNGAPLQSLILQAWNTGWAQRPSQTVALEDSYQAAPAGHRRRGFGREAGIGHGQQDA